MEACSDIDHVAICRFKRLARTHLSLRKSGESVTVRAFSEQIPAIGYDFVDRDPAR